MFGCFFIQEMCSPNSPIIPEHGYVNCTHKNKVGSECNFTCDKGYELEGSTISVCMSDNNHTARWNGSAICRSTNVGVNLNLVDHE